MSGEDTAHGPVDMRTDDVFALAEALRIDANRFVTEAARVAAAIAGGTRFGADPRNIPAVQAGDRHDDTAASAARLLDEVQRGLHSMSRSARAVITDFSTQDELNGATVEQVRRTLNLPHNA